MTQAGDILTLNNIEVIYDHVALAIKGVSVAVPRGGMIALLGANGAGKSTTLKAISGLLKPERGQVTRGELRFEGHDIERLMPQQRVRRGIVQVLEGRRVFEHLTPDENLVAASAVTGCSRAETVRRRDRVYGYFPRLQQRRSAQAGFLSGGEQQMLAIGRALARDVKLLLLDEPFEGLAPVIVHEIERTLAEIRALGMTTIIVEQNAIAALQLADRAIILDMGQIVFDGTAAEVLDNATLRQDYLAL
ncbi:MAG TPA: ABC transporter ATP-binding protein [Burkholderiaceae bacterium]|nr:ABC transporter ATP-binding protein [Burkholderiaceae bacterium]